MPRVRTRALRRSSARCPAPLRKTLTYDRGKEMAEHERLRLAHRLSIQVFFVDPHSPLATRDQREY